MSSVRRSAGRTIGNALLNVAALGGLLCIVLVVLALVFNISLIMFKTGSMSPTIPAGSLAMVREIPAADIQVGDVVTVDRDGTLPVTHRVLTVSGDGESRTITMQGDANDVPDPDPYTVSDVRRVIFAVPELAKVVVWFSNPWVLAGLTISASVLVTWAFWPRSQRAWRDDAEASALPEESAVSASPRHAVRDVPEESRGEGDGASDRERGRSHAHGSALVVLAGALVGSTLLVSTAAPAEAADIKVVQGEYITLTSIGDTAAMRSMTPSEPVTWLVGVDVDAPEPGTISVALSASGSPALGLSAEVQVCATQWQDGVCAAERSPRTVISGPVDLSGAATTLATLPDSGEAWVRIVATANELSQETVTLAISATGGSDTVSVSPGGPVGTIAVTGRDLTPTLWLAAVAIAVGLGVAGVARIARRQSQRGVRP